MLAINGTLYICPTPLGNLEDISLRVLRILKEVDLIAAEDTRHSMKLLSHYKIGTKLISYHQHSSQRQIDKIIITLQQGNNVALISDAGTPGISDPGQQLVAQCVAQDITIDSLPGANAAITALAASAFPLASFTFYGFLPRKGLKQAVAGLVNVVHPVVLYESPYRVADTVRELAKVMPDRQLFIAREISKMHQQFLRGRLTQISENTDWNQVAKGEFVLILGPGVVQEEVSLTGQELSTCLYKYLDQGVSPRDAARLVSEETGAPRRQVYQLVIGLKKNQDG